MAKIIVESDTTPTLRIALESVVVEQRIEAIIEAMAALTPEQRLRILGLYCPYCGGDSPCQCWNDE